MAKYLIVSPNSQKEITIADSFHQQIFIVGNFMYDDRIARDFPQYFKLIPEEVKHTKLEKPNQEKQKVQKQTKSKKEEHNKVNIPIPKKKSF